MGLYIAKLEANSDKFCKTQAPKCTSECEQLVIDGLTQNKYKTVKKTVKEFFKWHDTLENTSEKVKNQSAKLSSFTNTDLKKNMGFSSTGYQVNYTIKETPKISGAIKTSVNNSENLIQICGWLSNLTGNDDVLQGDLHCNSNKTINNSKISYDWPLHEYDFKPNLHLAFCFQNKKPTDCSFQLNEHGLSCGVTFELYQNIKQFLNWEGVVRHQASHGMMSMLARANCGYSLKSSLKHSIVYDDRDSTLFPTKGSRVNLRTEISGLGGDVRFLKNDLQVQHIFSLPQDLILETSFGCGLLNPFNCKGRYMETFSLGGPSSVRGFCTDGIGPKNECVSSYWVGNMHLYLPFMMRSQDCSSNIVTNYHIQFFVNSGNIGRGNNCLKREIADLTHRLRISCGIGLVVSIKALGRIEVNYCIPVRQQGDDRIATGLQFGINFDFS